MQIIDIDLDAWPEIQAENSYNDPPTEGYRFVMWSMDVENVRGSVDEDEWANESDFEMVGSRNVHYYRFRNSCGVIPDELNDDLYRGGKATGNVCLAVPIDETGLTFLYDALHDDENGDSFRVTVWFKALPPVVQWRGLRVAPEDRCAAYDSNDYRYPQSVEDRIVEALGGIYGPYTGRWFESTSETDIEHMVARSEAHDSGMCNMSDARKKEFSKDLLNLTLASPSVNRQQKSAKDAADWLPGPQRMLVSRPGGPRSGRSITSALTNERRMRLMQFWTGVHRWPWSTLTGLHQPHRLNPACYNWQTSGLSGCRWGSVRVARRSWTGRSRRRSGARSTRSIP